MILKLYFWNPIISLFLNHVLLSMILLAHYGLLHMFFSSSEFYCCGLKINLIMHLRNVLSLDILMFFDHVSCSWIALILGKEKEMGTLSAPLRMQLFVAQMGKHTAAGVPCVLRTCEYSLKQAFSLKPVLCIITWYFFFLQSLMIHFVGASHP